jgi:hypothetical protein
MTLQGRAVTMEEIFFKHNEARTNDEQGSSFLE